MAEPFVGLLGMMTALIALAFSLLLSGSIEKLLGRTGLNILSKVSGLILAAMAAEIIFTGIDNFLA
jgi:multiple antibiotic resistance protein